MNPYMVLIGALKWIIHPSLNATPVWATWFNIWWVKRKCYLKVQTTKIIVFFIMMPCNWWQQRKLVSGRQNRDTKKCGYWLKWIYLPATLSSNATEVVHLGIALNFVILIPVYKNIFTRQWIVMLCIHIHCMHYIQFFKYCNAKESKISLPLNLWSNWRRCSIKRSYHIQHVWFSRINQVYRGGQRLHYPRCQECEKHVEGVTEGSLGGLGHQSCGKEGENFGWEWLRRNFKERIGQRCTWRKENASQVITAAV